MSIEVACECGRRFRAKDQHSGLKAKCPDCGRAVQIPMTLPSPSARRTDESASESSINLEMISLLSQIRDLLEHSVTHESVGDDGGIKEYKVLTQKDKWFSGKFDPEKLEQAINSYAGQGWRVKGVATANVPGFGGNRDELIVVLER